MTEETRAEATLIETKGQAEKSQSQQQEEQQKTITETQPQKVEDTSTTTTEEVCLADSKMIVMILHQFHSYIPGTW